MKKLLKFVVILIVALLVLVIGGLIAGYFYGKSYVQKPEFRTMVVEQIEKATKRKAEFGGINFSVLPPALIVDHVALKNKEGTANFIALNKLDVKINPLKAEISKIILNEPEINVKQFKDGSFNFSDMLAPAGKESPEESEAKEEPQPEEKPAATTTAEQSPTTIPVDFNVALIQISKAKLKFTKEDADGVEKSFDIPNFDLAIKNISLNRPVELELDTTIGKETTINIGVSVGPVKTIPPDIAKLNLGLNGKIKLGSFSDLEAFIPKEQLAQIPVSSVTLGWEGKGTLEEGFNFTFKVSTPPIADKNQIQTDLETGLQVSVSSDVLQQIMNGNIPEDIQSKITAIFKGKLDVKAELVPKETLNLGFRNFELNVNEDVLKIEDFKFNHKETNLAFNMNVKGLNPNKVNPVIDMKLTGDKIVVHELLKALPQAPAESASSSAEQTPETSPEEKPASESAAASEPVEPDLRNIPFIDKITLDSEVNIKEIYYEKNLVENLITKVHLEKGQLTLNPMSMNLFDGSINETAEANLIAYPLTYKTSFKIDQMDINKAQQANAKEANYYGKLIVSMDAEGTGVTTPNLKANLFCKGEVLLKDGKSISKDGSLLDQVYIALDNPANPMSVLLMKAMPKLAAKVQKARAAAGTTTETVIEDFILTFNMEKGTVYLTRFQVGTPDYIMKATGTAQPFDNLVDIKAQMNLSEKATNELTENEDMSDRLPYENNGLLIPLAISGNWTTDAKTLIKPDFETIGKKLVSGQVSGKVKGLFKGKGGDEKKEGAGGLLGGGKPKLGGLF
ncbi:MAG: AsmA family protein [Candidatus Aureabacteria bacterium]|nr:AsmA family protein [Candidatus Auribacterota bacterium]